MESLDAFAPIAHMLRREILEHFEARGHDLDDAAGRRTLDTNSVLAPRRADMLAYTYLTRSRHRDLAGLRVGDFGCGFGSLALVLAQRGAQVIAFDPNVERIAVGRKIAEQAGLDATFLPGHFEEVPVEPGSLDAAFVNNSLCYVVDRRRRRLALSVIHETLTPGGWVVLRNPNRSHPVDPFTRLPLVHRLPVPLTRAAVSVLRRHRSEVRLTTPRAAVRELRRAGFVDVRFDGTGEPRRPLDRLAGYHHVSGRRPERG